MHVLQLRRLPGATRTLLSVIVRTALLLLPALLVVGVCGLLPSAQAAEDPAVLPVTVVTVEQRERYVARRRYAGTVVAGRRSALSFTQAGEIGELFVDLGDRVSAGQVIGRLVQDDVQAAVAQAQAALTLARAQQAAAQADHELATDTTERIRNLFERGHVSAQSYDEQRLSLKARTAQLEVTRAEIARAAAALKAARVRLDQTELRAPFAGIIQDRHLDEGARVNPANTVFELVSDDRREARVGIPDSFARDLKAGTAARVLWQGDRFDAILAAVSPEIDRNTRTLTAVYRLEEPAPVPIGSVVELEIDQPVASRGSWLPLAALTESDRGLWGVYVVNADQTLERRLVEIVHTESDPRLASQARVFVRGTLDHGERVVAGGVHRLVPGQRVRPSSTSSAGTAAR